MDRVDESLLSEIQIWQLVSEKIATLKELETTWSLDDVYRALSYLDLKSDIAKSAEEKARHDSKRTNN